MLPSSAAGVAGAAANKTIAANTKRERMRSPRHGGWMITGLLQKRREARSGLLALRAWAMRQIARRAGASANASKDRLLLHIDLDFRRAAQFEQELLASLFDEIVAHLVGHRGELHLLPLRALRDLHKVHAELGFDHVADLVLFQRVGSLGDGFVDHPLTRHDADVAAHLGAGALRVVAGRIGKTDLAGDDLLADFSEPLAGLLALRGRRADGDADDDVAEPHRRLLEVVEVLVEVLLELVV